ncbi:unnamed protein product [Dicrocoelium dendriticum]|nr:unnamed protein product [Dicrocoelium dendriticum]
MVIVMFEDAYDLEPLRGYLRVGRWIYPLARSFSPIYVWGPDRLVFPDPFCTLTEPIYIVVRVPTMMSRHQKDTLWNLLDVSAHVRGKFAQLTAEQILELDKLFELTELTPADTLRLDRAEDDPCPPGTRDLPSFSIPAMRHKLLAFEQEKGKRSISFANATRCTSKQKSTHLGEWDHQPKCVIPALHQVKKDQFSVLTPSEQHDKRVVWPGNHPDLIVLPPIRGNLMRLYILGPRDPQHIYILNVPQWIPLGDLILKAVDDVFQQQVRLRKEKEQRGIPPSFDGRKKRLIGGWGGAESLNAFGVAEKKEAKCDGPHLNLDTLDPALSLMFQTALGLQDLEAAAGVFDYAVDTCKLELISFDSSSAESERSSPTPWLGPLIPRCLLVRYRKLSPIFAKLMTISAAVEGDLVYKKYTNYIERIHEDCEHHYPKRRPRNPLLDPRFPYPREPTSYNFL